MSKCKPATNSELAWCERLRKVLAAHPKKLWLFAGDGVLHVMKYPEDGEVHKDNDNVDDANSIASYFSEITADGGGW
jgi:hypothetical protein